jgi:hypothetical protein
MSRRRKWLGSRCRIRLRVKLDRSRNRLKRKLDKHRRQFCDE